MIKNKQHVAAEIFTTGACNLACAYCYIEKNQYLQTLHKEVIEKLKTGKYISELKELYGDQLECLSFWGTEPLISLNLITDKLPEIVSTFPKLKEFAFSTNLILNPKVLIEFVDKCSTLDRDIKIKAQISLDGPEEITDLNRMKGTTKTIKSNFITLVSKLQRMILKKTTVELSFKPTWNIDNLKWLNREESRYYYYFFFFDKLIEAARRIVTNPNIRLNLSGIPTLAVPGTYDSADGLEWTIACVNLKKLKDDNDKTHFLKYHYGSLNPYVYRLLRLYDFGREFYSKPEMFSCSAGRSQLQLGTKNDLHMCHRTLFFNHPEYTKNLNSDKNWDFLLQQQNKIKLVNEKHIGDITDPLSVDRLSYIWSAFQGFSKHKIATGRALIKELVYSNQINQSFENEDLAELFSIFINYCLSCPAENILQTGTLFSTPLSLYRLFGRGAFEIILKECQEIMENK